MTLKNIGKNIYSYIDDYERYKTTILYQLQNKCSKRIKNVKNLEQELKNQPEIQKYDEEIEKYKEKINELDQNIQNLVYQYKIRVKQLKDLLRTDLNTTERNVVNMALRDERKEYNLLHRQTQKQNAQMVAEIKKDIKDIETQRSKQKNAFIKGVKVSIKKENANIKNAKNEIKKIRKTIHNRGVKNEVLKSIVDKYSDAIEENMAEIYAAQQKKDNDATIKQKMRETKKLEQEQKKQEAERKKWIKEQIKAVKEQDKNKQKLANKK